MQVHRKIWIENFGDIPLDTEGRTYEVHHIDGNHSNNSLDNLIALPIRLHHLIHLEQGDFTAANLIAKRMQTLEYASGFTGKPLSEEHKRAIGDAQRGKPKSQETRDKIRKSLQGRKVSEETIEKRIKVRTGKKYNKEPKLEKVKIKTKKVYTEPRSEEHTNNIRIALIGTVQPTLECPHCGKIGGAGAITRWHFDNCKNKK
jgi:hypothetical protein